jgi:hypothetical protein
MWFLMRGLRFLLFVVLLLLTWVVLEETHERLRQHLYQRGPGAAR